MSKSNTKSSLDGGPDIESSTGPDSEENEVITRPDPEPNEDHEMPEKCNKCMGDDSNSSSDNEAIDEAIICSPAARLTVRRKTRMDKIYAKFPKPEGHVPPTAFPGWAEWSMSQKLPQYPYITADFWTREKIGNDLRRPKKCSVFHLDDENNMERVPVPMTYATYTALHDPAIASYLKRPEVLERLQSHGLVTEENRVICTQREFNEFRNYLRTLWADDVKKEIALRDECARQKIIQDRWIKQYQNVNFCEHELKKAVAKQRKCDDYLEKVKKIQDSIRMKEERYKKARQMRECGQMEKIMAQAEREKNAAQCRKDANDNECARRRELVMRIVCREKAAAARLERDKQIARECAQQYKCEWLDSKWEARAERTAREQSIRFSLRADQKRRAKHRQARVEYLRKNMAHFIELRQKEEVRIRGIVTKYFYRWLNKVRERKAKRPDELHTSLWDIKSSVDNTNDYLKERSGYENLDDFVLNVMKMKRGSNERGRSSTSASSRSSGQRPIPGKSSKQILAARKLRSRKNAQSLKNAKRSVKENK